jgi:hypothetical protein
VVATFPDPLFLAFLFRPPKTSPRFGGVPCLGKTSSWLKVCRFSLLSSSPEGYGGRRNGWGIQSALRTEKGKKDYAKEQRGREGDSSTHRGIRIQAALSPEQLQAGLITPARIQAAIPAPHFIPVLLVWRILLLPQSHAGPGEAVEVGRAPLLRLLSFGFLEGPVLRVAPAEAMAAMETPRGHCHGKRFAAPMACPDPRPWCRYALLVHLTRGTARRPIYLALVVRRQIGRHRRLGIAVYSSPAPAIRSSHWRRHCRILEAGEDGFK